MDRKELVKLLGEHFGVKPKYMGVPSCAYQIETAEETYTVDRAGIITTLKGVQLELQELLNLGVEKEAIKQTDSPIIEIAVPMEGYTGRSLRNLVNMINSKQELIKKSLGIEENIIEAEFCKDINASNLGTIDEFKFIAESHVNNNNSSLYFDFDNGKIVFRFLEGEASPENVSSYIQLVSLLNQSAKGMKYVSPKSKPTDNDKFSFRVFLIRLGMIGDEYKTARKILLENLEGNSAFRSGKKPDKVKNEDVE